MHPDLEALLALQEDDAAIARIEARLREVDAQVRVLDRDRAAAGEMLERIRADVDDDERRRRELAQKVQEHKALQERNLAALDAVRKAREASAAMAQIDITRKVLAQEESDLQSLSGRVTDRHQAIKAHEAELEALDQQQAQPRAELAERRATLEADLAQARERREASSRRVPRLVLMKYERIRGRDRGHALYPLRGQACGRCNTAIPLQRRNVIAAGRSIEVCEACGVLLYATA